MAGSSPSPAAGDVPVPPSRSASSIVAGVATGYHVLRIVGYSHTKEVPTGQSISSSHFLVGGRTWLVKYFPNGSTAGEADFISLFLALHDHDTVAEAVKAKVSISLLDQEGKPVPPYNRTTEFVNFSEKGDWGYTKFMERKALEESKHLSDDCFTVRFDVTVMKDVHTVETPFLVVPPSDTLAFWQPPIQQREHRCRIQSRQEDILCSSACSFNTVAGLQGPALWPHEREKYLKVIHINDMEADVFDALLTFMYTDNLPKMKEQEESALAQHLLVAADRYNLERLKLICEDKLCKHIDKDSASTILALAEQHNCHGLKDACLAFLSSSSALGAIMETDGFKHLTLSCPGVLKELVSKVVPR
ncbi:unnamed protein product [Urochloa humidicola]